MNYKKIGFGIAIAIGYTYLLMTILNQAVFNVWKSYQPYVGYFILVTFIYTLIMVLIPLEINDKLLNTLLLDIPMALTIAFNILIFEELKLIYPIPNSTINAFSGSLGFLLTGAYFTYMGKGNIIMKLKGGK